MTLTSQIRYVFAADTSVTDGSGKTGLAFGDITAKYLIDGGTLTSLTTETITTLGTYQAPTSAAHIRIKELANTDPTKGIYEVHFHNTQLATGTRLWLFLSATGAKFQPLEIELIDISGRLPTALTAGGNIKADVLALSGDTTAADNCESFFDGNGYGVHIARTTVSSVISQTILMLNAGTISLAVANAYKGCMVIIRDHTDTKNVMFAVATAYDESTGQLTIDPTTGATLTIAANNIVEFVVPTYAQDDRTQDAAIKAKTDNLPATPAATSDIPSAAVIADAVWDEAIPGAYIAGKAGYIVGTYLDAAISTADTIGPGADLVTLHITKGDTTPIPDADVWITNTTTYDDVYAGVRRTDSQGDVQFMLQAGDSYYLWMSKQGYLPIEGSYFTAVAD